MRIALLGLFVASTAAAGTYEVGPTDDLFARLAGVKAGDEVIVHAGTYTTPGFFEVTWAGTAQQPISIHAAPGEHVVIQGTPAQNIINISGSYFAFSGFELRGGSHGLRLKSVDHATLSDLVIHDLGDVGISCNFEPDNCDAVTIRHDEIYDTGHAGTGEGLYLGCNDAACTFTNSLVENNYIHDMGGDQGDGIEIKSGSYGNVVRDNVIVRSKYPGITMYGYAGTGERNIVERNLVWHATADNGIQIVGQVIVRNNIVIDAAASGIASKPSQAMTPHDALIQNNTIVSAGAACIKTNNWATEANNVIVNNAVYCEATAALDLTGGVGAAMIAKNIGLGTSNAAAGFAKGTSVAADLGDPSTGKVYPPTGSALIDGGAAPAAADDFNGTTRTGTPDVGAYERTGDANPGWIVVEGFKTPPAPSGDGPPPGDDVPGTTPGPSGCCSTSTPTESASLALLVALVLRRRRRC